VSSIFRIDKLGLKDYYECKHQDLFKLQEMNVSFGKSLYLIMKDYILFVESFPVIPEEIMRSMILYSTRLVKSTGYIIFMHNLLSDVE
jgi:hypothetical protein